MSDSCTATPRTRFSSVAKLGAVVRMIFASFALAPALRAHRGTLVDAEPGLVRSGEAD